MSFKIILQQSMSAPEVMDKSLFNVAELTGTLKDPTSLIDPVILVESEHNNIMMANYLRIQQFGRYYYINNIRSIRSGLYELSCHVDVLMSWRSMIRRNKAIIHRSENNYELNLDDGSIKVNNNPIIQTKSFPSGFTTSIEFILAVAGGSGS